MEAKHTKGPWHENEDLDGIRLRILDESGDIIICQCFHANGIEERKYNARLISSAPELLEALEKMIDEACGECMKDDCGPPCDGTLLSARAAIAKAKGEA